MRGPEPPILLNISMLKQEISAIVASLVSDRGMFLVSVTVSASNVIDVEVDKFEGDMGIDDCVQLSRAIEEQLDREAEDFELTVGSPGLGYPYKVPQQFQKSIGMEVDVVMRAGSKLKAVQLIAADEQGITVRYLEKIKVEGKKKKQEVVTTRQISFDEIKSVNTALHF